MMLEGTNASVAIRWIRQDLNDVLEVIRDNLEDYAADPQQRDSLKTVQDKLEQLNLTFLTMEQHGASLLTDEMIAAMHQDIGLLGIEPPSVEPRATE